MRRNCPFCGTELLKTNLGEWLCPNCGIIKFGDEEPDEDNYKGYLE